MPTRLNTSSASVPTRLSALSKSNASTPSWVGQTPQEFENSTGNKLMNYSTDKSGKLINFGTMSYTSPGSLNTSPLINNSYNSMMGSSYKIGDGGSPAIEGLAKMMGGSIPNPYQFAKMTSQGEAEGAYPYKKQLMNQQADIENQAYAFKSGYSSPSQMNMDLQRQRQLSQRPKLSPQPIDNRTYGWANRVSKGF